MTSIMIVSFVRNTKHCLTAQPIVMVTENTKAIPRFARIVQPSTHSKDCIKTVTRHIWADYIEFAEDIHYTPKYQELYRLRKEKIERVFADAKEKHAMRYTPYKGLAQVTNWVRLKFAAMNLKKLAKWKWISAHDTLEALAILMNFIKTKKNPQVA